MTPARRIGKCTEVAVGAVSVEPQAESIVTRRPAAAIDNRSSACQRVCGSAAAA